MNFNAIMDEAFDTPIAYEADLHTLMLDPDEFTREDAGFVQQDDHDDDGVKITHVFKVFEGDESAKLSMTIHGDGFVLTFAQIGRFDDYGYFFVDTSDGFDMEGTNLKAFAKYVELDRDEYVAFVDAAARLKMIDDIEAHILILSW